MLSVWERHPLEYKSVISFGDFIFLKGQHVLKYVEVIDVKEKFSKNLVVIFGFFWWFVELAFFESFLSFKTDLAHFSPSLEV